MITKLSKKQEKLIPIYQKKWLDQFHSLSFDENKAKDFVDWLYALIDKKPPIKIVLDSPLAVQLAVNILKKTNFNSQLNSQLDSQLDSQLNSQLHSQLR